MIPCHSRRAGKNIMSRAYAAETRALAGSLHTKHSVKKKKKNMRHLEIAATGRGTPEERPERSWRSQIEVN